MTPRQPTPVHGFQACVADQQGRMEDHVMSAEPLSQLSGSRRVPNVADQLQIAAARVFDTLLLWQARGRQRRALARFDDHMLQDIGCSRQEVARECAKPFWRA
jgi:uncharacterized protein YjiS (DUF1127 family)